MLTPRLDAIVVGLEVTLAQQDPERWIPIEPDQAQDAFVDALSVLPASGGTLHVLPGSAPYVFQSTVSITAPDVRIRFAGGAGPTASSYLTFPDTGGGTQLFAVSAPRFRCEGAYVKHEPVGGTDDGRSCFLVSDADDASFLSCTFDMQQVAGDQHGQPVDLKDFSCIRSTGASATSPRRGLRVSESTFRIRPGARQSQAASGGEPTGICCVRATDTAEVLLTKTVFRGPADAPPRGACGPVVLLDNCPASVLTDLVFQLLQNLPATSDGSLVRIVTHGGQDGHRTVLGRFTFENNDALHMIELVDVRSDVVAFANLGRQIGHCEAAIAVQGAQSDGIVLHAMNLHNTSAGPGQTIRMIDLQAVRNATLGGLSFAPFLPEQLPLRITSRTCSNVQVEPEQALVVP